MRMVIVYVGVDGRRMGVRRKIGWYGNFFRVYNIFSSFTKFCLLQVSIFFSDTLFFNIWMMFWFYFDSMWLSSSFYFFMFHGLVIFGNDKLLILTWFLWIVLYLYLYLVIPLLIYLFFFSLNKYLSIYYLMSILLGIVYSFLLAWNLKHGSYLKCTIYKIRLMHMVESYSVLNIETNHVLDWSISQWGHVYWST